MGKLIKRYDTALKALDRLFEDIELTTSGIDKEKYYLQFRRSTIQSFEIALDVLWKFLKECLEQKHGIEGFVASPKGVIRSSFSARLINDAEFQNLNIAVSARNETSHLYDETTAEDIFKRIPHFAQIMKDVLQKNAI